MMMMMMIILLLFVNYHNLFDLISKVNKLENIIVYYIFIYIYKYI
jgi:hypothetical protein